MVYIDGKWRVTDRDELVNDIYENKRAYVIENLDTFIHKLDENKKKSLKRWLNRDDNDEGIINIYESQKYNNDESIDSSLLYLRSGNEKISNEYCLIIDIWQWLEKKN
jgi:hypothetical protein